MAGIVQTTRWILIIAPHADQHSSLRRIFDETLWECQSAFTKREGIDLLRRNRDSVQVVICEQSLPDGDWKGILAELDKNPVGTSLIVSSRLADDRLWAEVLNLGAFDLVVGDPFDPEEVLRVTENAWLASTPARKPEHLSRAAQATPDTTNPRRKSAFGAA
jgi:DNA-binding NtrC family response regulator